ncbi:retrovirus-related pol polyprotein from transposon TNT 1-94 [Tanacetum coccineum]
MSLEEMMHSSSIYLLSKASKTKSWLWHQRLSHLNFGTINDLAKQGLVRGLPKFKYQKDNLCAPCSLRKSKKHTHKPKFDDFIQEKLYLLHMDLYGPIRIQREEKIQVRLNATVRNIRTNNGTEFVNQTLKAYYEDVRAEALVTACYTQNRSLIPKHHNKTPYELLHDIKPDLMYFHVFGALCYPTNDSEDLGKLKPKADIGIFIEYAPVKKVYQIYNKRTRLIMETIHVEFNELTVMASEQFNSGVEEQLQLAQFDNDPFQDILTSEPSSQESSSNVQPANPPFEHLSRWTKDHPLDNVIGNPSRAVSTRRQLQTDAM